MRRHRDARHVLLLRAVCLLLVAGSVGSAGCGSTAPEAQDENTPPLDGMWAYEQTIADQPAGSGYFAFVGGQLVLLTDSTCDSVGHLLDVTASNLTLGPDGSLTGTYRAGCPAMMTKPTPGADTRQVQVGDDFSLDLDYAPGPGISLNGVKIGHFTGGDVTYGIKATRVAPGAAMVAPSTVTPSPCVPDMQTLCLNGGRFQVKVDWRNTLSGQSGPGIAVPSPLLDDEGLFWFFAPDNWEIVVKVIGGCGINDHFWVFYGATTNVEYTLTVTDTITGAARIYTRAVATAAEAITDTFAFFSCR